MDIEWQREQEKFGINKMKFMLECLHDLDLSLKKMGTRLFVLKGDALTVIKQFCKDNEITQMTSMKDAEVFYRERDTEIKTVVERLEVVTKTFGGHTLFDPQEIISANEDEIPLSHSEFYDVMKKVGDPLAETPAITSGMFKEVLCPIGDDHEQLFAIPTLADLGFEESTTLSSWTGGEYHALKRLDEKMADENLMRLPKDKTEDSFLLNPTTTGLSPYMNYGCLSPKRFWNSAKKLSDSKRVSIQGQLMYREFFYTVASSVNNFTKMEGNRICRQIEWYQNEEHVAALREGRTGYPWIDAIMRQMVQEGFTHHICRYALTSFVCLGDLWLNWTVGQEAFEEFLIDGDYAMNAGCWMWCSGSAFSDQIPTRVLDPIKFGQKWDPKGKFIRKYCPELKNMPIRYLFAPWKAPRSVQEEAKCTVGTDYPTPIVDHRQARAHNADLIREMNNLSLQEVEGEA